MSELLVEPLISVVAAEVVHVADGGVVGVVHVAAAHLDLAEQLFGLDGVVVEVQAAALQQRLVDRLETAFQGRAAVWKDAPAPKQAGAVRIQHADAGAAGDGLAGDAT